jgi:hypothetical protein
MTFATSAMAQTDDASTRIKEVLPAPFATRILTVIARARAHELPAEALENRALKFAAKGVQPDSIEKSVVEHEARMERGKESIERARGSKAAADEVEAAAEVLRKGVDGPALSEFAKSAPSGRSLAVPLYVVGGLVDGGVPSNDALRRVAAGLRAKASDRDLEKLASEFPPRGNNGNGRGPDMTGRPTDGPGNNGIGFARGHDKRPVGVPANGGAAAKPGRGNNKPPEPQVKKP